jgi:hypothetical protein
MDKLAVTTAFVFAIPVSNPEFAALKVMPLILLLFMFNATVCIPETLMKFVAPLTELV